jgi:hypothetical protein
MGSFIALNPTHPRQWWRNDRRVWLMAVAWVDLQDSPYRPMSTWDLANHLVLAAVRNQPWLLVWTWVRSTLPSGGANQQPVKVCHYLYVCVCVCTLLLFHQYLHIIQLIWSHKVFVKSKQSIAKVGIACAWTITSPSTLGFFSIYGPSNKQMFALCPFPHEHAVPSISHS